MWQNVKAFFFWQKWWEKYKKFPVLFFPFESNNMVLEPVVHPSWCIFLLKRISSVRREFQIVNVVVQEKEVISQWNGGVLFFFNPSELDVGDWNCCSRCISFTEQLIPSGEKKEKIWCCRLEKQFWLISWNIKSDLSCVFSAFVSTSSLLFQLDGSSW